MSNARRINLTTVIFRSFTKLSIENNGSLGGFTSTSVRNLYSSCRFLELTFGPLTDFPGRGVLKNLLASRWFFGVEDMEKLKPAESSSVSHEGFDGSIPGTFNGAAFGIILSNLEIKCNKCYCLHNMYFAHKNGF